MASLSKQLGDEQWTGSNEGASWQADVPLYKAVWKFSQKSGTMANFASSKDTLPLQGCVLQLRDSRFGPTQSPPLYAGGGLSHFRLLY